jgi:hypothetical protein
MSLRTEALGIEMIFSPRGLTGRYEPLDRLTLGALKSKESAKWQREFAHPRGEHAGERWVKNSCPGHGTSCRILPSQLDGIMGKI